MKYFALALSALTLAGCNATRPVTPEGAAMQSSVLEWRACLDTKDNANEAFKACRKEERNALAATSLVTSPAEARQLIASAKTTYAASR